MKSGLDEEYMRLALGEAGKALSSGEVPVGAVLVRDGEVLASGHNGPIMQCDPTAHAEIVVMRAAARMLGNYRLTGTVLYVTIEPCVMCMGAMILARVPHLVYACRDPRAGAVGSIYDFAQDDRFNHKVEVTEGVLGEECSQLLSGFFKELRAGRKAAKRPSEPGY